MEKMKLLYKEKEIDIGKIILGGNFKREFLRTADICKIIDVFLENGGKCIDTARSYNNGLSEAFIGRWIKMGRRDKLIISTKGGGIRKDCNICLNKQVIEQDLDMSLKALGTDYIDIYWLHRDDENMSVEEIVDYMNYFVESGKIGIFGASNWSYKRLQQANEYAMKVNKIGFSCSQIQWSVGRPNNQYYDESAMKYMNKQEYNWYRKTKFPVFAYSSQSKGFFYHIHNKKGLDDRQKLFDNEINRRIYVEISNIATQYNVPLSYPVLGFFLSSPLNIIPIVGYKKESDLIECFSASTFLIEKMNYEKILNIQEL